MVDTGLLKMEMDNKGFRNSAELARATKLDYNTVNDLVTGKRTPSFNTATVVFKVLGISSEQAGRIFFGRELR